MKMWSNRSLPQVVAAVTEKRLHTVPATGYLIILLRLTSKASANTDDNRITKTEILGTDVREVFSLFVQLINL